MEGEVELPDDGMTTMLPEAVADALLADAVAEAEVGMLVAVEERSQQHVNHKDRYNISSLRQPCSSRRWNQSVENTYKL
jgi:hypothetical protein